MCEHYTFVKKNPVCVSCCWPAVVVMTGKHMQRFGGSVSLRLRVCLLCFSLSLQQLLSGHGCTEVMKTYTFLLYDELSLTVTSYRMTGRGGGTSLCRVNA